MGNSCKLPSGGAATARSLLELFGKNSPGPSRFSRSSPTSARKPEASACPTPADSTCDASGTTSTTGLSRTEAPSRFWRSGTRAEKPNRRAVGTTGEIVDTSVRGGGPDSLRFLFLLPDTAPTLSIHSSIWDERMLRYAAEAERERVSQVPGRVVVDRLHVAAVRRVDAGELQLVVPTPSNETSE